MRIYSRIKDRLSRAPILTDSSTKSMYITSIKKKSNTNKNINIIPSKYDKLSKYTKLKKKMFSIKIKRYHHGYFQQVDNVRRNCGQFSSYRTGPNPFPPLPSYDDNYRKSLSRGTANESKILPLGRGCSSKGHTERRGRGLGKKTRDKKQTFPLFTKERFVRGPGRGGGWVCLIFRTQTRFTRVDARRHSCHAWNSRHNGVCSRFANRPNIRVVPGSCAVFTRCQKACEG